LFAEATTARPERVVTIGDGLSTSQSWKSCFTIWL
jgi:hypothetical protein